MTAQRPRVKLMAVLWGLTAWSSLPAQAQVTARRTHVELRTELGAMVVALYNETPAHRDNFLALARAAARDSLLFYRVVPGFTIQGGSPLNRRSELTLPAEIVPGLINKKGALGAVREGDQENPERRSNAGQFYIVQGTIYSAEELVKVEERSARYGSPWDHSVAEERIYATRGGAPHLDGAYTVFGEVVEGLEVLDAIAGQPCNALDRPVQDIHIFMRILE